MIDKLYKDKEWLFHQYITLKKSTYEIKEICRGGDINYWLKKFKIPIRSLSEAVKISHNKLIGLYKDRDWLFNEYINLNKSTTEIGKICEVNNGTIYSWLKKLDIPIRTISEALKIAFSGERNPMYGKHHTEATKKKISDALSGEKCYRWKGEGINLEYSRLHKWINKYFDKPELCEICEKPM